MNLVQKIKANSSKWMKTKDPSLADFFWQDGYGAFSVNPQKVDKVVNYIRNQHTHHGTKDFKEEYRTILKEHDVDYDEEHLWT